MKKEAVEGMVVQTEEYYPKEVICGYGGDLKHGDKVKLIILSSDDKIK